jgi:lipopolysaccharide export system permease protein
MLIRTLGQAALGRVAPQDVVLLLGYIALGQLPTMLALSLFIAVVATLGRMYRDSEMAIWFTSGVGLTRFVRPVVRMSWPVLLVVALLALFVWPWVNQRSVELKERFERRSDVSRVAPGQFQTSSDGRRVFFIERDAEDSRVGRNVFVLATQGDTESVTTARSGHTDMQGDDRFLVLSSGQRNEQDLRSGAKTLSRFETFRVQAGERVLSSANDLPPKARRSIELLRQPSPRHQGELVWRLGLVLGSANLLLLGVGLSASNPRRASNWNLLFALLSFVVYYNLINLSQAWVSNGKLGMGTALVLAHGGAFLLAMFLLWWRESGNSRRLAWLQRGNRGAAKPA